MRILTFDYAARELAFRRREDVSPWRLGERVELIPAVVADIRNRERKRKGLAGLWAIDSTVDPDNLPALNFLALTPEQYREIGKNSISHAREWAEYCLRRQSKPGASADRKGVLTLPNARAEPQRPSGEPETAVKPSKARQKWEGHGMTGLMLALGAAGFTDREAERALAELALEVAWTSIQAWAKRGRNGEHKYGSPVKLTAKQQATLKAAGRVKS